MIFFIEKNRYGAWVVYGTNGLKQYYGFTKSEAMRLYKESDPTIVCVSPKKKGKSK